jgi:hypothetical protein
MLILAAWFAAAAGAAVVVGRAIRRADVLEAAARDPRSILRRHAVPQLDVPLWRGTDLDPSPYCAACGCGFGAHTFGCPALDEVSVSDEYPPALAGAILGLAFATDETTARYWLAMCARRGADATTLRDLRAEWDRQRAADAQTLHTDRVPPEHCPHCNAYGWHLLGCPNHPQWKDPRP